MKKLIYILIVYISSVYQTGDLFSSSTLIMFFAIYFALTFILAYWMYYFKFSYGINLLKEFVPSFVFWILPFVKASINHLNLRNNITELSDEAFQIIQNIKNPDNTELLGSEYVGYWEEYDKKDRVLFNEKISKKLKNQLIDNLNSVIDLNPNEFYYVMESRTLTEELSAKAKGITLNHNNPSDKKLIVFNWLTLPNSLTLKYKKALKEYERMKEKSSKKLREFNDDENALVTNYGVCPKCYKNISMLARKCPHCTADLG
mgnify:CR=1 FL=1